MDKLNLQSSQLTTFMACPRKWYYQYHCWRGIPPNAAMKKGSCFHLMAELYYKDGVALADLRDAVAARSGNQQENLLPYFGECLPAFIEYLIVYEKSPYKIVEIDGAPAVELEFKLELTDRINYRGKFDSLRERNGKFYIVDWKVTAAALTDWYFRSFELGPQNFSYSFTGKECFDNLDGFFIDAIQIKNGKHAFAMKYFPILSMLDEFVAETIRTGEWILEHIDNEDFFEHRYTGCINKYNRKCEYADVCLASPARREYILQSDLYVSNVPIYDFNS